MPDDASAHELGDEILHVRRRAARLHDRDADGEGHEGNVDAMDRAEKARKELVKTLSIRSR